MRRLLMLAVPLLLAFAVVAPAQRATPVRAQDGIEIAIQDFAFSPDTIEVSVGTTITWTNNDQAAHTVTADDGAFDSGRLRQDDAFSFTFDEPGTFTYHCDFHPAMVATIVVVEGDGGEEPADEPQADEGDAAEAAVSIVDFAFDSDALEITAGTTVTWTNNGDAPHTATADDGAFDSGTLDPGASFSFTFDEPGTYAYHCDIHQRMVATIVVLPAEEEAPADDDGDDEQTEPEGPAVEIVDFAFEPAELEVDPGDTVTWTNTGEKPHTVTADDGAFDSGRLEPGDSFSFTFDEAGGFAYHCEIHPDMQAIVTVADEEPETTPEPTSVPTGPAETVGVSLDGGNAIEFVGRIEQRGTAFSFYGYLTAVAGLETSELFTDPDPANWSEETARFLLFGSADLTSRQVIDDTLFVVTAAGTLSIRQSESGATFDNAESFLGGTTIAEGELAIRNNVAVVAESTGVVSGGGSLTLTTTTEFAIDGAAYVLGAGRLRLAHDGLGNLLDPDEPRAVLAIAGYGVSAVAAAEPVDATDGDDDEGDDEADDDGSGLVVALDTLNDSGIAGSATLTDNGDGTTTVTIALDGATGDHPVHVHAGSCDSLDPNPAFPLTTIDDAGASETAIAIALADLTAEPFAINVHKSADEIGIYVACGNITA